MKEVFLQRMAKNIVNAQWAYQGNQIAVRAKHLNKEDMHLLIRFVEQEELCA